ncbi:predicted protein [Postia placenta Mad-698-R]|nr:predicted protein [Postia placenta Mad-698-R]
MTNCGVQSLSGEARTFYGRKFGIFNEVTSISGKLNHQEDKTGKEAQSPTPMQDHIPAPAPTLSAYRSIVTSNFTLPSLWFTDDESAWDSASLPVQHPSDEGEEQQQRALLVPYGELELDPQQAASEDQSQEEFDFGAFHESLPHIPLRPFRRSHSAIYKSTKHAVSVEREPPPLLDFVPRYLDVMLVSYQRAPWLNGPSSAHLTDHSCRAHLPLHKAASDQLRSQQPSHPHSGASQQTGDTNAPEAELFECRAMSQLDASVSLFSCPINRRLRGVHLRGCTASSPDLATSIGHVPRNALYGGTGYTGVNMRFNHHVLSTLLRRILKQASGIAAHGLRAENNGGLADGEAEDASVGTSIVKGRREHLNQVDRLHEEDDHLLEQPLRAYVWSGLPTVAEIPTLFPQRSIILRQYKASMYHPFIEALSLTLMHIPIMFATMMIFSVILYFLSDLQKSAERFFLPIVMLWEAFTMSIRRSCLGVLVLPHMLSQPSNVSEYHVHPEILRKRKPYERLALSTDAASEHIIPPRARARGLIGASSLSNADGEESMGAQSESGSLGWVVPLNVGGKNFLSSYPPVFLLHEYGVEARIQERARKLGRASNRGPEAPIVVYNDPARLGGQRMGLERMTLVGHSLEGYLSVAYALKYPTRVSKVILLLHTGVLRDPNSTVYSHEVTHAPDSGAPSSDHVEDSTWPHIEEVKSGQQEAQRKERQSRCVLTYLWEDGWIPLAVGVDNIFILVHELEHSLLDYKRVLSKERGVDEAKQGTVTGAA